MPDEDKWERAERLDLASGEMGRPETTIGGLVARAALTRTGVLEYRNPDGSVRRELRHPDEVFDADSLDSLAHATLTDDHPPGKVNPGTWRQVSIGHLAGRPTRGDKTSAGDDLVEGEVHIQHGPAIEKADRGDLREASCGYSCAYDPTPGVWKGQPYDGIQRRIRYNHVAFGPPGWGRAGSEVRMRLDALGAAVSGLDVGDPSFVHADHKVTPEPSTMTDAEKAALEKAEKDAREANAALEQARTDAATAKTEAEKAAAKTREDAAELAKLRSENEVLKLQAKRETEDSAMAKVREQVKAELEEGIQLRADAKTIAGDDFKTDGKTNEQVKRELIAHMEPELKLDAILAPVASDAKAVAAVLDSTYRIAKTHFEKVSGAHDQLLRALKNDAKKPDGDDDDVSAEDARDGMIKRRQNDWKKGSKFDKSKKDGK